MCEDMWGEGKVEPEVVGGVSEGVASRDVPPAQVGNIEKRVKTVLDAKKDSIVLRMHLADLYDKHERYAESETMYREVLVREPGNAIALNNLAWLVAVSKGNHEEVLKHIDTAIERLGRRGDLLDTRGLVNLALNRTGPALADLQEAVNESATPSPTRLFHLCKRTTRRATKSRAEQTLRQGAERRLEVSAQHPLERAALRRLLEAYDIR